MNQGDFCKQSDSECIYDIYFIAFK